MAEESAARGATFGTAVDKCQKFLHMMKTRRKYNEADEKEKEDITMAPRPEDSPASSPRTRSPSKGARAGGASCTGQNALSMLNMLAEVASVTLHTDPSVTDANLSLKSKTNPGSRKPSETEVLTLEQVSMLTDNLLIKLFAEFESNEMWKRFTYTCRMLPAACSNYYQSFGSELKARASIKVHLHGHLKNLLQINASKESRQNYVLESIPARKRRLTEQESSGGRRRNVLSGGRSTKSASLPKAPSQDGNPRTKKTPVEMLKDQKPEGRAETVAVAPAARGVGTEAKTKRKLDNQREGKNRAKKMKNADVASITPNDDFNNNSEMRSDVQDVVEPSRTPPMQEIVSHDHGYLKATTSNKPDTLSSKEIIQGDEPAYKEPLPRYKSHQSQVLADGGGTSVGGCVSFCVKESQVYDQNTLLHQHMNQELEGEIMAQDTGSDATPLPVVGCEVEFTPDQQYKVMRSADLPVVYDHNNHGTNIQTVSRIIERDEYKVRKKPKGRAKFIGQSKAEKEMALKLITEIRSQSVMALDTLECKICNPPRLFTALSTLLSHYRSHAGIRPYECRICEAVFTRQHSLNYHMLIHTNQTRFTCIDCGRKFRHPSHFKEHRRRHTGESPYECSDCLMRFKTRNTYKRHLRTRHEKLLTTQGTIIILSQEEADRMKKTQGRKPRRPRQPLQIISPETAAQMEEEQIWTDFEEGDREDDDEEEDEDEEEGDEASPLDLSKKTDHSNFAADSHLSHDAILKTLGNQPRAANGKTGLFARPKKVNVGKNGFNPNLGVVSLNRVGTVTLSGEEVEVKEETIKVEVGEEEETIEEEVVTEEVVVDDLRTYIFHPSSQNDTLPKVNIKSSWNTVTDDLISLENSNCSSEAGTYYNNQSVPDSHRMKVIEHVSSIIPAACSEIIGDSITPEEVITICAGTDVGGKDVVLSPIVEQQANCSGVKPEWFTVKKPLKCYGRPGCSSIESNGGIVSSAPIATTHLDVYGPGVYVYVQGQDGRLARVYQGGGSFIGKSNQSLAAVKVTPAIKGSIKSDAFIPAPNKPGIVTGKPLKTSEFKSPRECLKAQILHPSRSSYQNVCKPIKASSHRNTDRVVINKQVVNNVVVKNHIVQNGSLVKCEERETPLPSRSHSPIVSVVPVTRSLHSAPVIVTSVTPFTTTKSSIPSVPSVPKDATSPPVIVTSVASVDSVSPSSTVVLTSVAPVPAAVSSSSLNGTPVLLPPVYVQSSKPKIMKSVLCTPGNVANVATEDLSQKQCVDWQAQPLIENVGKCATNGTKLVWETHSFMENVQREGMASKMAVTKGDFVKEGKTELSQLMSNEVDSLVTITEDLLLEKVEIIDHLDEATHAGDFVTGIVGTDGIVKLDGELHGAGELRMPFPCSDEVKESLMGESKLQSQADYAGRLIQSKVVTTENGFSDSGQYSPTSVSPHAQSSLQVGHSVHAINHMVSVAPTAIPSAIIKI